MVCLTTPMPPHKPGTAVVCGRHGVPSQPEHSHGVCFRPHFPSQTGQSSRVCDQTSVSPWNSSATVFQAWCPLPDQQAAVWDSPESPPEPDCEKVQVPSHPRQGVMFGLSVSPQRGAG